MPVVGDHGCETARRASRVGRATVQTPGEYTLRLDRRDDVWRGSGDLSVRLGVSGSVFAEWNWDGHQLTLRNDRYGMLPVFSVVEPSRVILSTTIEGALAAGAPADLDARAIAVILRLGYPVGDDTPFASIRTLPPGVELRWDRIGPRLAGGPFTVSANGLDHDQALDAYVDLFRLAIGQCTPEGRCAVPLSGGRDSRHILLALLEAGHRPDSLVTARHHPPRADEDVRIATMIAEELDLPHVILPLAARVEAEVRKNGLTSYCTPGRHAWYMPLADHIAAQFECSYDGIAGDVLSMARLLKPAALEGFAAGRFEQLAGSMLRGDEAPLRNMLQQAAYRAFARESAIERLVEELPRHANATNPVRSFRFWNYSRRGLGPVPFGVFRRSRVHAPYLDHDLFDMLAGLAPDVIMRNGGHFHTDAIKRGYPRYAQLPFETPNPPQSADRPYFRTYARQTLSFLRRAGVARALRRRFLVPRLVRCVLDPAYSPSVNWIAPRAIYLSQLQAMIERAATVEAIR